MILGVARVKRRTCFTLCFDFSSESSETMLIDLAKRCVGALAFVLLASCGGGGGGADATPEPVALSVTVRPDGSLAIQLH